jgi:hypothetical protein
LWQWAHNRKLIAVASVVVPLTFEPPAKSPAFVYIRALAIGMPIFAGGAAAQHGQRQRRVSRVYARSRIGVVHETKAGSKEKERLVLSRESSEPDPVAGRTVYGACRRHRSKK